ncbi:outer membrane beta-barrel family protein [Pontibacter diazotrophicus]|uniref:outer membrane beta-barrel family protein n=1 Tax=Pontibacter diazotrophicus TaxID=1400979 RepID=UPI0015F18544|nr:outer membrane beta-barrel family protein [Pontibacter diazotrophicus]
MKEIGNTAAIVATATTDENGTFSLKMPDKATNQATYILEVHHLLYNTYVSEPLTKQELTRTALHITLQDKTNMLSTVTVEANKPIIERRGNALRFNISGQEHLKGRSLEGILKNLPGVTLSPGGALQLFGKGGVAVFLNEDLQPLDPRELQAYLSSIDYSIIESIEIIPSASADADASFSSVIRIRTKTRLANLYSSNTLRFEHAIKPSIYYSNLTSLPVKNSTFNVFTSYSKVNKFEFNSYKRTSGNMLYMQETENNIQPHVLSVEPSWRHTFQNKSSIVAYSKFSFIDEEIATTGHSAISGIGYLQNINTTVNHSDKITAGVNYSLPLGKSNPSGRKLILAYDYSHNNLPAEYASVSSLTTSDQPEPSPFFAINTRPDAFLRLHIAKADYVAEKEKFTYKLGAKATTVDYENKFEVDAALNSRWVQDSLNFREYRYQESTYAAYASVTLKPFKSFDATLGLRGEQSSLGNSFDTRQQTLDTSYFQLFPSANLAYTFANGNLFGYNLTRRINRPNFNQLNPTLFLTDPYTYLRGNETLLPQVTTINELFFILHKNSVFSVSHTHVNRYIAQFPFQQGAYLELSPQNFAYRRTWTLYGSNQTSIAPWWQLSSDASVYNASVRFGDVKQRATSFKFGLRNNLTLPMALHANVDFQYEGPGINGIFERQQYYTLAAGIRRSFLEEKLTVGISANDLFYSFKIKNSLLSETESIQLTQRFNSRLLSVSVNYVIHKAKGQRINKATDEELQRF